MKLPEGLSRDGNLTIGEFPDDFMPLVHIGLMSGNRIMCLLEQNFGDLCQSHDDEALRILAYFQAAFADTVERHLKKQ